MDNITLLDRETLVTISNDFDYLKATENFVGLKLFPLVRTENMKLAVVNLLEGASVPVTAFVHALDSEARVGERQDFSKINVELLLIKEKLNQGESLRKKVMEYGMEGNEANFLREIFNDAANLISRVLTRMEVAACQLLSTGSVSISENGITTTVDYGYNSTTHNLTASGWNTESHDIIGDLIAAKEAADNKIVRALVPAPVMAYLLKNDDIRAIITKQGHYTSEESVKATIKAELGIELVVTRGKYKTSPNGQATPFFTQNKVTFLSTDGEVGNTFVTSTPEEDFGVAIATTGFVSVTQDKTTDPAGIWTKATALALPCPKDPNAMWIMTVSA